MTTKAKALEKNRIQLELKLQAKMIKSLEKQGWLADKTSDRFKAGKPDLRISHVEYGQLDVELKYILDDFLCEADTGLSKLQWLKMKKSNNHGRPTIALVYSEPKDVFFITTVLRDTLPKEQRQCLKLPGSEVISGPELFVKSMEHLHDLGYQTFTRTRRRPR